MSACTADGGFLVGVAWPEKPWVPGFIQARWPESPCRKIVSSDSLLNRVLNVNRSYREEHERLHKAANELKNIWRMEAAVKIELLRSNIANSRALAEESVAESIATRRHIQDSRALGLAGLAAAPFNGSKIRDYERAVLQTDLVAQRKREIIAYNIDQIITIKKGLASNIRDACGGNLFERVVLGKRGWFDDDVNDLKRARSEMRQAIFMGFKATALATVRSSARKLGSTVAKIISPHNLRP